MGYLSYDGRAADLLFEVVSRRYEEKSTAVTTNLAFADWPTVFPNANCVAARTPDAHFVVLECTGGGDELVLPGHLLRDTFVRLAVARDIPVLVADDALTDALRVAAGISLAAPRSLASMLARTATARLLRAHLRPLEATPQDPPPTPAPVTACPDFRTVA